MDLRVITSNIRYDDPRDDPNRWNDRKDYLAETLLSASPDIIATQEGFFWQIEDLIKLFPNLNLVDQHRNWDKERMYPCVFYNPNLLTLNKSGDLWLSETPTIPGSKSYDSAWPRMLTWTIFDLKDSNLQFLFVNVHLDHIYESTRLKQSRVLTEQIKQVNTSALPLILVGDFNDSPLSGTRNLIMEQLSDLYDPWIANGVQEHTSHHGFKGGSEGERIDWILLDKNFKVPNIELDCRCKKLKNPEGTRFPSDHYPVKCCIQINLES